MQIFFRTTGGVEWNVNHRFRVFRELMWDLEAAGVHVNAVFPKTYFKSSIGVGLTTEQLNLRASVLAKVSLSCCMRPSFDDFFLFDSLSG